MTKKKRSKKKVVDSMRRIHCYNCGVTSRIHYTKREKCPNCGSENLASWPL